MQLDCHVIMSHLSFRTPLIYRSIVLTTLLVSLIAACFPAWMNRYGIYFVVVLIIVIGVPHGVADCLLFKYSASGDRAHQKIKFYLSYILLGLISAICLYLAPNPTISAFIAVSAYHLGQAHLSYPSLPKSKLVRGLIYSCWGAFVILAPILANPEVVTKICNQFLGSTWVTALLNQPYLLLSVLILNILVLNILIQQRYLSTSNYLKEVLNLFVLAFLFHSASLIISFGTYFTLWHSLSSTLDQVKFTRKYNSRLNLSSFYWQVIPLSLVLVLLFAIAQFIPGKFDFYQSNSLFATSLFFGSLVVITFPHALLRDRFYQN